jgi:hypothetical protein
MTTLPYAQRTRPGSKASHNLSGFIVISCLVLNGVVLMYGSAGVHSVQLHISSRNGLTRISPAVPCSLQQVADDVGHHELMQDKADQTHEDMRYQISQWLSFAEHDAATFGTALTNSCNASLGRAFLEKFKQSAARICKPAVETSKFRSIVECNAYPVEQRGLACSATNLVVDATALLGIADPAGSQEHSGYLPAGLPGSLHLNCQMMLSSALSRTQTVGQAGHLHNLEKEALPWFKRAWKGANDTSMAVHCGQAGYVVEHPVMFVVRLDTTNPYHHTQVW